VGVQDAGRRFTRPRRVGAGEWHTLDAITGTAPLVLGRALPGGRGSTCPVIDYVDRDESHRSSIGVSLGFLMRDSSIVKRVVRAIARRSTIS
jgi:hypothetical protein